VSKQSEALERVRDLPTDELTQALDRATDELFRARLGHYTNQIENTISVRDKRREVARIQTVLRARQLGLETQMARGAAPGQRAKAGKAGKRPKRESARKDD
jgi:large subunit ribosomal protein L29